MGHLELDSVRRFDRHRVRVAERQLEVLALELGAVADALDLEALLEAGGHALDHVRDERARQAVQGTVLAAVGRARDDEVLALLRGPWMSRWMRSESSPFGPLTVTRSGSIATLTPGGDGDGLAADATHALLTTPSPRPRRRGPLWRASWPVMTPCEVEMIAVPSPPWIFGMWAWGRRRSAGRAENTRWMPWITGLRLPKYLSLTEDLLAGLALARGGDVIAVDVSLLGEDACELDLEGGRGM